MPKSALPEHLNDPEEIENSFPDDKRFGDGFFGRIYTWFHKTTKTWTAFGPRATEWWAKWRELPVTVFAAFGPGLSRWEDTDGELQKGTPYPKRLWMFKPRVMYLSAIQYWTKWHIQIQWPLFIACHYYIDPVPKWDGVATGRRVFYFRIGARRDADRVYWCPSFFIGLTWN